MPLCPSCNRNGDEGGDWTVCRGCRSAMIRRFGRRFTDPGSTLGDLMLGHNAAEMRSIEQEVRRVRGDDDQPPDRADPPHMTGLLWFQLKSAMATLGHPACVAVDEWEDDPSPFMLATVDEDGGPMVADASFEDVLGWPDCVNGHEYDTQGKPL